MQRLFSDMQALHIRMLHHNEDWQDVKIEDVKMHYNVTSDNGLSPLELRLIFCPNQENILIYQILRGRTYKQSGGKIGINYVRQPRPAKSAKKTGAAKRKGKIPQAEHVNIMRLYNEGVKQTDIAKQYKVTPSRINRIIKANGT